MFALNMYILLRGMGAGTLNKNALLGEKRKKSGVFVLQGIIGAKGFNKTRELSVNHVSKLYACNKSRGR